MDGHWPRGYACGMAIVVEGFTVIVRLDRISGRLSHPTFEVPNSTALFDDHLWRCAFMTDADAHAFSSYLGKLGMNVEPGPDCDVVLIDEFDIPSEPPGGWLRVARWEKAVIAWRAGTELDTVVAREGWDPKKGSGLMRVATKDAQHLEFLGSKDGVETYLDKELGKEVYVGRTKSPVEVKFEAAKAVIVANFKNPGEPPVSGETASAVSTAVAGLEQLLTLDPNRWDIIWLHGKGLMALGKLSEAYGSFRRAFDLEQTIEAVPRELAGVCLELGKFEEAVTVAQQAVALAPSNPATLGNLALAQLLAQQLLAAKASNSKALELDPNDHINLLVQRVIDEVRSGARPQPMALRDLTKPATANTRLNEPKKPFWKFW